MKKSFVVLAALGSIAGAVQAQSSVTIYGVIDTSVTYTRKALLPGTTSGATGSKLSLDSGLNSGSRLGFKGIEDLGGGLKALFQLEMGFANDTGALDGTNNKAPNTNTLFRRKSVVGLSGNFGSVLLGRQTDFLQDIFIWTSVADFGGATGTVGHYLDRTEGARTNNSIRYDTPNFDGFTAGTMIGLGEVTGQTSAGQSFALGAQYANGPLGLFAAYYQSKLGTPPTAPATSTSSDTAGLVAGNGVAGDTAIKVFSLGASYQAGPARLYANWSNAKQPQALAGVVPASGILPSGFTVGGVNNRQANLYELGVNYAISGPLRLLASVQHNRLDFVGGKTKGKLTQINLGTDYFFSKRTDVYVFASNLKATDAYNPGVEGNAAGLNKSQVAVTVGLRHRF
ncbi:porin [Glaciimonas sp. PCH181]|uniref:porin n=1 Tax=Glaciimonas sp. PCH181 TaxID=2133943 RepID=UPI000D3958E8|nr:porin [Glaciimonas sp. PCH181]PUA18634.1 porin [Glaciimonas sp. PCH181]